MAELWEEERNNQIYREKKDELTNKKLNISQAVSLYKEKRKEKRKAKRKIIKKKTQLEKLYKLGVKKINFIANMHNSIYTNFHSIVRVCVLLFSLQLQIKNGRAKLFFVKYNKNLSQTKMQNN